MNLFSEVNERDEIELSEKVFQLIILANDILKIIKRQKNENHKGGKSCH